jgi:hypothetical protein|tara:strand:- start:328 stop:648 length:321 start_codon:yes stop_codon:yes gene_type:complete
MAKKQNHIDVVVEYLDLLDLEVKKRFIDPTSKDTIRHLIEKGIIAPKILRNYMIIYDFDCMLRFNEGNRTHTFMDLSIKYEISERQAQSIVYKERRKQQLTENITY